MATGVRRGAARPTRDVIESDRGGEAVRKWVAESSVRDRVRFVHLPDGIKDPSALHLHDPEGFVRGGEVIDVPTPRPVNGDENVALLVVRGWRDLTR